MPASHAEPSLDTKISVEQLVAHPGWKAVCAEIELAIEDTLLRLSESSTEAETLKQAHYWKALYQIYRCVRDYPLEVREILQRAREDGLLEDK